MDRQHKKYEKTLELQKMTYDKWIRQQEEKIQIDTSFLEQNGNIQTNDMNKNSYDGEKSQNE